MFQHICSDIIKVLTLLLWVFFYFFLLKSLSVFEAIEEFEFLALCVFNGRFNIIILFFCQA